MSETAGVKPHGGKCKSTYSYPDASTHGCEMTALTFFFLNRENCFSRKMDDARVKLAGLQGSDTSESVRSSSKAPA